MDESCQYSHVPAHAVMISDSERSMLILRLQLIYPLNFHLLNICFPICFANLCHNRWPGTKLSMWSEASSSTYGLLPAMEDKLG